MKFLTTLPESKHYKLISQKENTFIWQDKGTKHLQIRAEMPNPWGQRLIIMPSIQNSKSDTWRYPSKIILRCFEPGDTSHINEIQLIREVFKSRFYHPQGNSLYCLGFINENPDFNTDLNNIQWWVSYSFVAIR